MDRLANNLEKTEITPGDVLWLHASRTKSIFGLSLCLPGFFMTLYLLSKGEWLNKNDWVEILAPTFFGFWVVFFVFQLLPGCSGLKLDTEGFTILSWYRKKKIFWSDVESFHVSTVYTTPVVVWNFSPAYLERHPEKKASQNAERDRSFLDTYGTHAEDLAELLNQWREKWQS